MFAVGLSESLVQVLSRFPGLRVVGPVLEDGATDDDANQVHAGRRAHADVVLHGAVWTGGEMVRVAVHLTDAHDGTVRWSDTFERPTSDFTGFGAEDEIIRQVAATVGDFGGVVLRERFEPAPGDGDPEVAEALWRYYSFLDDLSPDEAIPVVVGLEWRRSPSSPTTPTSWPPSASPSPVTCSCGVPQRPSPWRSPRTTGTAPWLLIRAMRWPTTCSRSWYSPKDQRSAAQRHAEVALDQARYHPGNAYVAGMGDRRVGDWDRGIRSSARPSDSTRTDERTTATRCSPSTPSAPTTWPTCSQKRLPGFPRPTSTGRCSERCASTHWAWATRPTWSSRGWWRWRRS